MVLKVLFCDNSLRELLNFRGDVIRHFVRQGHHVVLIAPQTTDDFSAEQFQVRYVPIELNRSGMNPWQDWRYWRKLCRIYKNERPDYIFHYTIKPNIYGTLAARWCGIHSSAMIAGLGYVFYRKDIRCQFAKRLYRFALKYAEHVLVLNVSNRDMLLSSHIVSAGKLIHLPGGEGVDLQRFTIRKKEKTTDDKVVFLMIARLLYDKGYAEYVEAAQEVKKRFPNAEFQLLGDLDVSYPNHVPEERLKQDVDAGFIRYLGYCPDVVGKIHDSDCVVLPSFYNEGLSRVLMEAIAMGKVVITTDIPGCRETVDEGKNGFLVPVKDVKSLANVCFKVMELGDEERRKMGQYSREKAERVFDVQKVVQVYDDILYGRGKYHEK